MRSVSLLVVFIFCLSVTNPCRARTWRAGAAKSTITPDGPYWMGGYASRKRPSEGTLQDLYAKALVLEDDTQSQLVIVTIDLLVITPQISESIVRQCKARFGLDRRQILLNCSHTHCGPELRLYRKDVHNIPGVFAEKMKQYVDALPGKIVETIGRAMEARREVTLRVSENTTTFAINRRNNRGDAEITKRSSEGALRGPVDHATPVLEVLAADQKRVAVLFGYACHNTTLSVFQTCGDYAGYAQEYLEQDLDGGQAMFLMGAGGDQNPFPRRTVAYAQRHGQALATSVRKAFRGPSKIVKGGLRTSFAYAELEFQPHPPQAALEKQRASSNPYLKWKANFILGEIAAGRKISRRYQLPVQAVRLGDEVLLIAIGGETVVDYSLRCKREFQRAGGPMIWVAGYSNDVFGYLPSKRVLQEGGYEGGGHMVYTKFPGPFTDTVESRVFAALRTVVAGVEK